MSEGLADPHAAFRFMLKSEAPRVEFMLHSGHYVNEDQEYLMMARRNKVDKLAIKEQREHEMQEQFYSLSEKTHLRVVKHSVEMDREFYTLEAYWSQKSVPIFHRYYVLKMAYSSPFQQLPSILERQIILLSRGEHSLFRIDRGIAARQSCLSNLRSKLAQLSQDDVYDFLTMSRFQRQATQLKSYSKRFQEQGFSHVPQEDKAKDLFKSKLEDFFACLKHLHKLTVYVVDLVYQWKEYVKSLTNDVRRKREGLVFSRQGGNYLLSLLNDNHFLNSSFLSTFFVFNDKNDPFLFKPFLKFYQSDPIQPDDQALSNLLLPDPEDYVKIFKSFRLLCDQFQMHLKRRKYHDVFQAQARPKSFVDFSRKPRSSSNTRARMGQLPSLQRMSNAQKLNFVYHQLKQLQQKYLDSKQKQIFVRQRDVSLQVRREKLKQFNKRIDISHKKDKDVLHHKLQVLQEAGLEPSRVLSPIRQIQLTDSRRINSRISEKDQQQSPAPSRQLPGKPSPKPQKGTSKKESPQDLVSEIKEYVMNRVKQQANKDQPSPQSEAAAPQTSPQFLKRSALRSISVSPLRLQEAKLGQSLQLMFSALEPQIRSIFGLTEEQLGARIRSTAKFSMLKLFEDGRQVGCAFSRHDLSESRRRKFVIEFVMTQGVAQFVEGLRQTLNYLWDFQRPDQIQMTLFVDKDQPKHAAFMAEVGKDLDKLGFLFTRAKNSHVQEQKYLFKKPHEAKSYRRRGMPDVQPGGLGIQLQVLTSEREFDQTVEKVGKDIEWHFSSGCNYMLAQFFRQNLSYQEMAQLKREEDSAHLDQVLKQVLALEKRGVKANEVSHSSARSFQAFNQLAKSNRQRQYPFADKTQDNKIKRSEYRVRTGWAFNFNVGRVQGKRYFRMNCREMIRAGHYEGVNIFTLPTRMAKLSVTYIQAAGFLGSKKSGQTLSEYVAELLQSVETQPVLIKTIWVPQLQCGGLSADPQLFRSGFMVIDEFGPPLGKRMLIREQLSLSYEQLTSTGLEVKPTAGQTVVRLPVIVALRNEDAAPPGVYCRLFMNGLQ